MTITGTSGRPYPNVRRARQSQGWEAEGARQAVLISQAQHLEAKAARYRAEAAELDLLHIVPGEAAIGEPGRGVGVERGRALDRGDAQAPQVGKGESFAIGLADLGARLAGDADRHCRDADPASVKNLKELHWLNGKNGI